MSHQLINHNPDLKALRDEGFNIRIENGYLVVADIPYVASDCSVKIGTMITELTVAGDTVGKMKDHTMFFAGEYPCDDTGAPLDKMKLSVSRQNLAPGLDTDCKFSTKPVGGKPYDGYYHKITTYAGIISGPATKLDSSATPRTFAPIATEEDESVFQYLDTATSRADIGTVSSKLELPKVAIVGLGGTGSFILDLIAKTPVREIHLYDNDDFLNHNAFRAPGAASLDDLKSSPKKVDYYHDVYSKMHRHIHAHPVRVEENNVDVLRDMSFVFLCLDDGESRHLIVRKLEEFDIPFIDVGMGVNISDDNQLYGTLRVSTSTPENRDHIEAGNRIPYDGGGGADLYATNIQVADLNCLNACLAVIKWKKLQGFYLDQDNELYSLYTTGGNHLLNEDHA